MRCLSFFINKKMLGEKLCVGKCLKCLTVATPLLTFDICMETFSQKSTTSEIWDYNIAKDIHLYFFISSGKTTFLLK